MKTFLRFMSSALRLLNTKTVQKQFVTAFLFPFIFFTGSLHAHQTQSVVLVIIDGLRYSEGLGHPNRDYVPRMAALASQGAIVDNFRNDGFTYTSRAVPAIWCGAWTEINTFSDPACNGINNNYSELPTVFEYYRQQLSRPASDCVYVLKNLCSWKASFDPGYGPDYWPQYHTVGQTDIDVWHEAEQIIASQSPHFLLIYLADVDHEGHSGDWISYTSAITTADSLVGELWDVLQANPAYSGQTTLLVTNDHGRHDYNFSGHGDDCEGCRRIQLLAVGPDIQAGLVSDIERSIPDITPTIGELLGFAADSSSGTAMTELLQDNAAVESFPERVGLEIFNYPNPFNPVTTIQYRLPRQSDVGIIIYDLYGKQVAEFYLENQAAGENSFRWDTGESNGTTFSAGIYICQVRADNYQQSRKMILLK